MVELGGASDETIEPDLDPENPDDWDSTVNVANPFAAAPELKLP